MMSECSQSKEDNSFIVKGDERMKILHFNMSTYVNTSTEVIQEVKILIVPLLMKCSKRICCHVNAITGGIKVKPLNYDKLQNLIFTIKLRRHINNNMLISNN